MARLATDLISAIGGPSTVTSTVSSAITIVTVSVVCAVPSVTFSVNRTVVFADTAGAVKVVLRAVES